MKAQAQQKEQAQAPAQGREMIRKKDETPHDETRTGKERHQFSHLHRLKETPPDLQQSTTFAMFRLRMNGACHQHSE